MSDIIKSDEDKKLRDNLEKITEHKLSVEEIEEIIGLLKENKLEEIRLLLEKNGKKELIEKIISSPAITKQETSEEKESAKQEEYNPEYFTEQGFKKISALETKIENSEAITKDNFEKHPAHFKYVAYLLSKFDEEYHNSELKLRLRKTFLGTDKTSNVFHGVQMFENLKTGEDEKYFDESSQNLRRDFSDEELIRISNALIAKLRDYYYGEFLGLKNYEDYVIKKTDSKEVWEEKVKKQRILDAAITSRSGEFGVSNEDLYHSLKQMQEQNIPFGTETMLKYVEERIFDPAVEQHRQMTKQKILASAFSYKNLNQLQHFINDQLKDNPDLSDTHKEEFSKMYQKGELEKAKQIFMHYASKGFENYHIKEKNQFEQMRKIYSESEKSEDLLRPIKDHIYKNEITSEKKYE